MKRNLTVELDVETIRKAKVLAAQRDTSVSRLVADEIERLVGDAEAYERAKADALEMLDRGFDLGSNGVLVSRDELHERW
ncbi:MAG: hypothetical protein KF809_09790 [Chloroflexi bacterium]|nr:hypothetical protein [Chloroflexota bacterium]